MLLFFLQIPNIIRGRKCDPFLSHPARLRLEPENREGLLATSGLTWTPWKPLSAPLPDQGLLKLQSRPRPGLECSAASETLYPLPQPPTSHSRVSGLSGPNWESQIAASPYAHSPASTSMHLPRLQIQLVHILLVSRPSCPSPTPALSNLYLFTRQEGCWSFILLGLSLSLVESYTNVCFIVTPYLHAPVTSSLLFFSICLKQLKAINLDNDAGKKLMIERFRKNRIFA